jgi:hypothetical protein
MPGHADVQVGSASGMLNVAIPRVFIAARSCKGLCFWRSTELTGVCQQHRLAPILRQCTAELGARLFFGATATSKGQMRESCCHH